MENHSWILMAITKSNSIVDKMNHKWYYFLKSSCHCQDNKSFHFLFFFLKSLFFITQLTSKIDRNLHVRWVCKTIYCHLHFFHDKGQWDGPIKQFFYKMGPWEHFHQHIGPWSLRPLPSSSNHHAFFPPDGFVEILWFNWEYFTVFVFWLYLFFHQYS